MCDFRPGDEVVYIGAAGRDPSDPLNYFRKNYGLLTVGQVYVVQSIVENPLLSGDPGVVVYGVRSPHLTGAFAAYAFRKVQRRDLTAWLKTATKFEEPKRVGVSA